MEASSIVAIIAAISALIVAVMTRCRQSRCTEIDLCWDMVHLKRDVKNAAASDVVES